MRILTSAAAGVIIKSPLLSPFLDLGFPFFVAVWNYVWQEFHPGAERGP